MEVGGKRSGSWPRERRHWGHSEILNLNQSGRTKLQSHLPPPLSLSRPFLSSQVPSPQSILENPKTLPLSRHLLLFNSQSSGILSPEIPIFIYHEEWDKQRWGPQGEPCADLSLTLRLQADHNQSGGTETISAPRTAANTVLC